MSAASFRRLGTIAWSESTRTKGSFNRKTTIALFAIGLATAALLPPIMDRGFDFDRGIYRAAIDPASPLLPAIEESRLFQRIVTTDPRSPLLAGDADVAVLSDRIVASDTPKGTAALAALKQAAKDWSFRNLVEEPDGAAAFPVRVELVYVQQERGPTAPAIAMPDSIAPPAPAAAEDEPSTVSGGSAGSSSTTASEPLPAKAGTGFDLLPPERSVNTPETLSPPFPFRSLLLAYAFLIPMNFIVQIYAGSAIAERLDRKGEPLLASPARPWEIIVGKALPYFAGMMAICAVIVYFIGGGWLSLVAVMPLALTFLAMEFVAAMYARSFRELTFLTVFTSVLLTIYAFLPAVFTDVHPISLVSPITLVVFDLRGDAVSLGEILYSTLPLTLFSAVLFVLGAALYHEEDLFHQKRVGAKAVDSVARQIRGLGSALKLPFLLLPLVFIAELMLITFLFAWPVPVGTIGIMLAVALTEESFKAAPSYAGVRRGVIPAKRALLFGALVGAGFFLAEKAFLIASLAGLMDVHAGNAVLGSAGVGLVGAPWFVVAAFLAAPLALHVLTASITGWGTTQGNGTFAATFGLSVMIHTTYNVAMLAIMGGGLGL